MRLSLLALLTLLAGLLIFRNDEKSTRQHAIKADSSKIAALAEKSSGAASETEEFETCENADVEIGTQDSARPANVRLKNKSVNALFTATGVHVWSKKKITKRQALAKLFFKFDSITRGGQILCNFSQVTPQKSGSEFTYNRGCAEEKYVLTNDGIEQLFIFDKPISGSGELVISGLLKGNGKLIEKNNNCLTFGRSSIKEIEYKDAIVIDSNNRQAKIAISYNDNKITLSVPNSFLENASYPVTVDPLLGPVVDLAEAYSDVATVLAASVSSNGVNEFAVLSYEDGCLQRYNANDPFFMTASIDPSSLGDESFVYDSGAGIAFSPAVKKYCLVGTDGSDVTAILYDPATRTASNTILIASATNDGEVVGASVGFDGTQFIAGWMEIHDIDAGPEDNSHTETICAFRTCTVSTELDTTGKPKKGTPVYKLIKRVNVDSPNGAAIQGIGPVVGSGFKGGAAFTAIEQHETYDINGNTKYDWNAIAVIATTALRVKKIGKVKFSDRNGDDGYLENPRVGADSDGTSFFVSFNQFFWRNTDTKGTSSLKCGLLTAKTSLSQKLHTDVIHQAGGICYSPKSKKYLMLWSDGTATQKLINGVMRNVVTWDLKASLFDSAGIKTGDFNVAANPASDEIDGNCGYCAGTDSAMILYNGDSTYAQLYKFSSTGN